MVHPVTEVLDGGFRPRSLIPLFWRRVRRVTVTEWACCGAHAGVVGVQGGDGLQVFVPRALPRRGADLEEEEAAPVVLLYVNVAVASGRPASGGAAALRKI